MAVSREETLHIAALARLRLSDAEIERFTHQLNDILGHVEALANADIGVEPAVHAAARPAPLRADEPGADRLHRSPADIAVAWSAGFFTVPRLPALDAEAAEAETVMEDDATP